MPRGRPRKPSALRELEGNRSRTDIPPDMPLSGIPECPRRLTGLAREHFEFVAGELTAIGVTKHLDTEALAMMAQLWGEFWAAAEQHDIDGMCKLSAKWGNLAGKYGLTPADRAKIMATPATKQDPTELKYFSGTG